MAEVCVRVRPQMGSEGVYRVRVSEGYGESQMCCRDWAATREQGPNSINGHPRGHEHKPRTEEEGLQGGCSLCCRSWCRRRRVVESCLLCPAFSKGHTRTHTHTGRTQEEKQTQTVTPVKKVDSIRHRICRWPLPPCMNAMAIHCGAPITATRLSPIIPTVQLERPVCPQSRSLMPSCGAALQAQAAQHRRTAMGL